jgi:predicted amidohydrolase YtcJ
LSAELVFVGGSIYTGLPGPAPEAVAVGDGRIVAVGGRREIEEIVSARTEEVDLRGRLLLPGFNDAHVHPVAGGLERLRCDLTPYTDASAYKEAVHRYVSANPDVAWVFGGGWSMSAFPGGLPTGAALDEIVNDRPVFLYNRDHHGAWVTRALEVAGIVDSTPDPSDGRIERDAEGRSTGMLHEGAMTLVERLIPAPTDDDLMMGLLEGQRYLHSLGVTGWQDAIVGEEFLGRSALDVYIEAIATGKLTAKVRGALWLPRRAGLNALEDLGATREKARAAGFDAEAIKVMQDGVVESFTAGMIDPYLNRDGSTSQNRGLSFFEPEFLNEFVPLADGAGFQVHFHAIGDRAVRECLDAVAAAREVNGKTDNRHNIAHLQVVHPDDIPRFAELGVLANAQPLWAAYEPQIRDLNIPFLGPERTLWQYPFGSLLQSGATLAFGSDWPVSDPDPCAAVHVAMNRTEAPSVAEGDIDEEPLVASEAIDLPSAIEAYTRGSAYLSHLEKRTGTVEVGKEADLVVVDRDLEAWEAGHVDGTRVDYTFVTGEVVHKRSGL